MIGNHLEELESLDYTKIPIMHKRFTWSRGYFLSMHWIVKRLRSNPSSPFSRRLRAFLSFCYKISQAPSLPCSIAAYPDVVSPCMCVLYLLRGVVRTLSGVYEGIDNVLRVYSFAKLKSKPFDCNFLPPS